MIAKAIQKNVRISSRKATLVCQLIRGQKVSEAFRILENTDQKTAKFLKKLVASAAANAVNNHGMDGNELYVFSAVANQGQTLKRTATRAKGSSTMIRKRASHLVVMISDDKNEKAILNEKLLKPRAHQNKKIKEENKVKKAIKVETKIVDKKGVAK